jgi:hypothetical protein
MAGRNGAGVFTVTNPDFVSGTTISSSQMDANFADVVTAMSASIAVDGQTTITHNLPLNAKKLTGLAVGTAATDSLNLRQAQAEAYIWCGTAGGGADAITLTPAPAIAAYVVGQRFAWKAGSANTGAATVAISGLTAIALQNDRAALAAGDHAAGDIFFGLLDTTSTVQILAVKAPTQASLGLVIGTNVQAYNADYLLADVDDVLTAGFGLTDDDDGTKSSGSYTPIYTGGNGKKAVNGGAFTLAPMAASSSLVIQLTNNASAGSITTSGWTVVTGDTLSTTNGDDFLLYCNRINGFSHLHVTALQ